MDTFSMMELEKVTGLAARTVRNYAAQGLLPPTEYRGNQTRYSRDYLLRLLAIQELRSIGYPIRAVKAQLAKMSAQDLEAFAPFDATGDAPDTPATAPAAESVATPTAEVPSTSTAPVVAQVDPAPAPVDASPTAERWLRIPLLPGLDLQVADYAAPLVRRIAAEIRDRYQLTP